AFGGTPNTLSDVYALGLMLYECLSGGELPFAGPSPEEFVRAVCNDPPTPLRVFRPSLHPDIEAVCHRCLEKDPARRYGTALELAEDLTCFLEGRPVRARPLGWPGRLGKWARRNPVLAGVLGAL